MTDRLCPFYFVRKSFQSLCLSILQDAKRFDDPIAQNRKKFRRRFSQDFEHIARKLSVVRALLDDGEVVELAAGRVRPTGGLAEAFPHFDKLRGQQSPEERADADVGEIITAPSDGRAAGAVLAVFGMIKGLFHEPGEGLRAAGADCLADKFYKLGLQEAENVQRRTPNVQSQKCRGPVRQVGLGVRR